MRTSSRLKLGYAALAAVDAWLAGSSRPGAHRARRVTKPLLMPVLSASLLTDERARRSPLRRTTLVAHGFGWGGDVALLGHGTGAFATGAASFGLGHVAYLSGLLRLGDPRAAARVAVAAYAPGGPLMGAAAWRQHRGLGVEVATYTGLLAGLLGAAAALGPSVRPEARRWSVAGAATFLLSDSVLGTRTFLWPDSPQRLEAMVMATYTAAQLMLSEGAARA